jgi:hypothetical protein
MRGERRRAREQTKLNEEFLGQIFFRRIGGVELTGTPRKPCCVHCSEDSVTLPFCHLCAAKVVEVKMPKKEGEPPILTLTFLEPLTISLEDLENLE